MIFKSPTLAVLFVYFSSAVVLGATAQTSTRSDSELSRVLIGTWEVTSPDISAAPCRLFVSHKADGTFKVISILDVPALRGRAELQGKWRVADGRLVTQIAFGSASQPRYGPEIQDKISLQANTVILLTKDGEQQMHKASIPSPLPPLLPPHWKNKIIIEKPTPEYPIVARQLRIEGSGFFVLHINQETGTVESVAVMRSTGHTVLDQAAVGGLKRWRIKARTMGRIGIPVRFVLTGKPALERSIDSLIPSQSSPASPEIVRIQAGRTVAAQALPEATSSTKKTALFAPGPNLPAEAIEKHLRGTGVCILYIRQDGTVLRAEMLKSTGEPLLDKATIDAFSQWRFVPGKYKKVKMPITYTGNYPPRGKT
jgi:TonB family protein